MSLFQTIKMVLWCLFGIRSVAGSEADVKAFRPAQVLGVAMAMLGAFLAILIAIVYSAIRSLS